VLHLPIWKPQILLNLRGAGTPDRRWSFPDLCTPGEWKPRRVGLSCST